MSRVRTPSPAPLLIACRLVVLIRRRAPGSPHFSCRFPPPSSLDLLGIAEHEPVVIGTYVDAEAEVTQELPQNQGRADGNRQDRVHVEWWARRTRSCRWPLRV